jgi:hypothetical protein
MTMIIVSINVVAWQKNFKIECDSIHTHVYANLDPWAYTNLSIICVMTKIIVRVDVVVVHDKNFKIKCKLYA